MVTKTHEATVETAAGEVAGNGASPRAHDLLSFDDIIAASDIQTEYVDVPEWSGRVKVISLSGEDRGKVFGAVRAHGKQIKDDDEAAAMFYARVIAASLVDEDNKHIAGQSKALALTKKNAGALNRIYRVCSRLSGIGEDEEKKAVEDLKTTPSDGTGSD